MSSLIPALLGIAPAPIPALTGRRVCHRMQDVAPPSPINAEINRRSVRSTVDARRALVLHTVAAAVEISTADLARKMNVPRENAEKDLRALEQAGELDSRLQLGGRRKTRYWWRTTK